MQMLFQADVGKALPTTCEKPSGVRATKSIAETRGFSEDIFPRGPPRATKKSML